MKAAIYSRKSRFTGKGDSIENQILLCKEYSSNMDIDEFFIYEDEGFSGGNIERPKFQQLLKDAKAKKFNVLICYRLDRISRNISDFSNLIEMLQKLNIDFISIREQFDTSTPMGRAMMYIASVFAQLERETIAERVRDNMLELAKSGRWLGGQTPFGYESEAITYLDEELKERKIFKLSPIKKELEIVKLIYDMYLEKKSLSQVHKYLYMNNIKTKLGVDWTIKKLQLLLRSPIYVQSSKEILNYLKSLGITTTGEANGCGILIYNKTKNLRIKREKKEWIAAVSKHNGIIEPTKWLQVQRILDENKSKAPRLGKCNNAILTGLLKCSICGSNMYIKYGHKNNVTGERIQYYVCSNKDNSRGKRCSNPNIRRDLLEDMIIDKLKDITFNKDLLAKELVKAIPVENSDNCIITNINKDIILKEKQIENLVDKLSLDSTLSKYILDKMERLNNEILSLKEQLKSIENSSPNQNAISEFEKILYDFKLLMSNLKTEEKQSILKAIIKSIYYNGETSEVNITLY